jgi:dihydrofolate reductase
MVSAGPPLLDLGLILRARLKPDDTGDGPWNCAPDRVQRYVVSSTLTEPGWQQTTVLAGSPIQRVRALKERPGTSSSRQHRLCHTVIGAGLVDEYRLFTYPVVQARGRRLFPDGAPEARLRLVECRSLRSGITCSRYAA